MKVRFSSILICATIFAGLTDITVSISSTTNFTYDAIDGGWSPWSKIVTPCHVKANENVRVDCGGGVRKRFRSCTHPVPQGRGRSCEERLDWDSEDREAVDNNYPCNTHPCQLPGVLLWSEWSQCTKR